MKMQKYRRHNAHEVRTLERLPMICLKWPIIFGLLLLFFCPNAQIICMCISRYICLLMKIIQKKNNQIKTNRLLMREREKPLLEQIVCLMYFGAKHIATSSDDCHKLWQSFSISQAKAFEVRTRHDFIEPYFC